jgi:hypothetical protein
MAEATLYLIAWAALVSSAVLRYRRQRGEA